MSVIELKGIVKQFGNVRAVDRINVTAQDKEFLVLVGPSGCGKTTTLRMIAGLEEITEGEIYIAGRKVNNIPPKDRDIAMVFQNYALYPHMNVYKNMSFGLHLRKFSKSEIDTRVKSAANILGIEDLLSRKPKELSGGQRQRVAMGRAIVRKPLAFLFDEPLSNLDAKLRVHMRGELKKLHEQLGTTTIYVTHDQVEAMTLASQVVVMNQGHIMQEGPPLEVYNNPKNLFVAGFIGSPSMNFMDGDVSEENGSLYINAEGFKLLVPKPLHDRYGPAKNRKVILGIRPEHIHDEAIKGFFPGGEIIRVKVEIIEPVGPAVVISATWGSFQVMACLDPQTTAKPHTDMRLLVDMNRIHLFEKSTGDAY